MVPSGVRLAVGVAVRVVVLVGVLVASGVRVAVRVTVRVAVLVGVLVGAGVAVRVAVAVAVGAGAPLAYDTTNLAALAVEPLTLDTNLRPHVPTVPLMMMDRLLPLCQSARFTTS